jgi:hypothetical protein
MGCLGSKNQERLPTSEEWMNIISIGWDFANTDTYKQNLEKYRWLMDYLMEMEKQGRLETIKHCAELMDKLKEFRDSQPYRKYCIEKLLNKRDMRIGELNNAIQALGDFPEKHEDFAKYYIDLSALLESKQKVVFFVSNAITNPHLIETDVWNMIDTM